jgi:hypothetical protein
VTPRLPSDGLVWLNVLLLQTNASLNEPPMSAPAAYARIYTGTRAPVKTFSPERPKARYAPTPLHGRFPFLGRLVPRRVAPSPTRRGPTQLPKPPSQPQERRVDGLGFHDRNVRGRQE